MPGLKIKLFKIVAMLRVAAFIVSLANQGTRPAPIMKMLTTHSLLFPRISSGMCCRALDDHTTTLPWEKAPIHAVKQGLRMVTSHLPKFYLLKWQRVEVLNYA